MYTLTIGLILFFSLLGIGLYSFLMALDTINTELSEIRILIAELTTLIKEKTNVWTYSSTSINQSYCCNYFW